jgi:hypothetical protein
MRGDDQQQNHMFSYFFARNRGCGRIIRCMRFGPWWTKCWLDSRGRFDTKYARVGRRSIAHRFGSFD